MNSKTASWARAYSTTNVSWTQTQPQIYKMLNSMGIYDVRFTNMSDKFAIEFLVPLGDGKPRAVRILVPIKEKGDEKKRERELNIVHRVLLNHLKAKFVAISAGLTEFEQEFMAHLVITDDRGNSRTMGELVLPQYKSALEQGRGDISLLPSGNA